MHELGLLPICFKKNLLKLDKILDLLAVFKVKNFQYFFISYKRFSGKYMERGKPKRERVTGYQIKFTHHCQSK